ncbi:MAG: acetyl-CoA C-acetyltransferase [Dehalococcoidia bacterium]|jgi:acetyl-CoA C-acetyltransferase|nr:acetyl-CoA C-acetyltransferase [Dehalococcoidia bacterium]
MREVVIVSGCRTAIGNFGGSLKDIPVVDLGAMVMREALLRAGLRPKTGEWFYKVSPDRTKEDGMVELEQRYHNYDKGLKEVQVDEVVLGNVLQAGLGQNAARQATVRAGIPKETPAFTVNKVCGSGLKAITVGAQPIMLGEADVVVAGGMENMSCAPYGLPKARWGYRMDVDGVGELRDLMVYDGLWEIFYGFHMGNTAEEVAARYGITREEQDEVGAMSHQRARAAIAAGLFKDEILPVELPQRKGEPIIFDTDERPMDTSKEKMAKLRPAFRPNGTVTAGNASGINDAAAAVVMMTREKANELGLKPVVSIKSFASGAVDPKYMGIGPIPAIRKALHRAGLAVDDLDVVELNEAFAAQAIACARELGLDWVRTNPHGSGISLGHPIGCTGARQVVTLMHDMARRNLRYGVVSMCIGGGQGMAAVFEREV